MKEFMIGYLLALYTERQRGGVELFDVSFINKLVSDMDREEALKQYENFNKRRGVYLKAGDFAKIFKKNSDRIRMKGDQHAPTFQETTGEEKEAAADI
jgi:hypothetical protein